jgi:NAD(P)-dependent dehydrogenase (short-subunit alcohol dehydrogenase family)
MKHTGKVALVTGAAQGIGHACAARLCREGAKVVLLDLSREVADAAKRLGDDAMALECDLSKLTVEHATHLIDHIIQRFGRLDILVNNAGVIHLEPFLDFSVERFDWVMAVNVRAPVILGQAAAKAMISGRSGGAIVNLSSVTAEVAASKAAAYCASKGAMRQLTKVMALELIEHGIRVNAVGPGTIQTDMSQGIVRGNDELGRTVLSRTPIGRFGDPDEIAKVVSFLASEDSSYVVGQTVYADGGRLILNYTVPVPDET